MAHFPITHRDLDVWQLSMDLVISVYQMTKKLPDSERFGLVAQMRRAAVSVPSNIAEGAARSSSVEFARFVVIARASLAELETQVELVERLNLCEVGSTLHSELKRVRQMSIALIKRLTK